MNQYDHDLNFKTFVDAKPSNGNGPNAPREIISDLVVSRRRLCMVYVLGSVAGYLLSLAICAQCSVGLSPLAWKTAGWLHEIPDPWCPLICGSIFGVAPFLAGMAMLTRFQHRYLLYRMTWLPVVVPMVSSISMSIFGAEHALPWQLYWLAAAVVTPYALEALSGTLLRQVRMR